jgi:SagB-type dehydrogenase family enzyme
MPEEHISLPEPVKGKAHSLEDVIATRRSARKYGEKGLEDWQISQLLWAAQGITGKDERRRAAPSAGGFHPLFVYVLRSDGAWRYYPVQHTLVRHSPLDLRAALAKAAWDQKFISAAPCVFVFSADHERTTERYGDRGRTRYVPMDVGHSAQNLLLQAVALGLVAVPIGAFDDAAVGQVLALPAKEEPLYIVPVGHAA